MRHAGSLARSRGLRRTLGLIAAVAVTTPTLGLATSGGAGAVTAVPPTGSTVPAGRADLCPSIPLRSPANGSRDISALQDGVERPIRNIAAEYLYDRGYLGKQPDGKPVDIALIERLPST